MSGIWTLKSSTTEPPWRHVCKLRLDFGGNDQRAGTGWFVGPHTVLTAAHCVFDTRLNRQVERVTVVPGVSGGIPPFGEYTATKVAWTDRWQADPTPERDYGVVVVGGDLGIKVGSFGVHKASDAELRQGLVIAGYPTNSASESMYFAEPISSSPQQRCFDIDVPLIGGASGSPVWLKNTNLVIGIAVREHQLGVGTVSRVADPMIESIIEWLKLSQP